MKKVESILVFVFFKKNQPNNDEVFIKVYIFIYRFIYQELIEIVNNVEYYDFY